MHLVTSQLSAVLHRHSSVDVVCVAVQLLHLHIVLAVQGVLCVWLHAPCLPHHDSGHHLRHHCLHVLPAQRRGLSMVSHAACVMC